MDASVLDVAVRLTVSLAVVVGALLVLRRWGRRALGGGRGGPVEVESRTPLAKGSALAVVRVDGRRILLGVTEHHVSLVTELAGGEERPGTTVAPVASAGAAPPPAALTVDALDLDALAHDTDPWPRNGLVARLQRMTLRTEAGPSRAPLG